MPVLPEVASTMVLFPGTMRPSASAASIIATPILSFRLPAGLYISSLARTSPPPSGDRRSSRTIGVPPTMSARLSGMERADTFTGATLTTGGPPAQALDRLGALGRGRLGRYGLVEVVGLDGGGAGIPRGGQQLVGEGAKRPGQE